MWSMQKNIGATLKVVVPSLTSPYKFSGAERKTAQGPSLQAAEEVCLGPLLLGFPASQI